MIIQKICFKETISLQLDAFGYICEKIALYIRTAAMKAAKLKVEALALKRIVPMRLLLSRTRENQYKYKCWYTFKQRDKFGVAQL